MVLLTFGLVGFYGISTIVDYFMPNNIYIYIYIYIYVCIYIYQIHRICQHILLITFLNKHKLVRLHTDGSKYCNSIKNQSFVYTQLDNRTVLFPTIQFSTQFKCQTDLFDP